MRGERTFLIGVWLAVASDLAAQTVPTSRAAFVVRRDSVVLLTEQFARSSDRLEGESTAPSGQRVSYTATLRPDATVPQVEVRVFASGAAEPLRHVVVDLAGDTAVVRVARAGSTQTQRVATPAGVIPTLGASIALIEQAVRRARVLGGEGAEIPLFSLDAANTVVATVAFTAPDSARMTFAGQPHALHLRVDADGRVLGGHDPVRRLAIARTDTTTAAGLFRRDYSAPSGAPYTAEEVRVPTPAGHVLAGTLTLPTDRRGAVPAVVTITGSSPHDRDNSQPGLPYRIFAQVADTLGRRGVAVLRLDDRGVGASTGTLTGTTTADRAEDTRAALAYLRSRPEIDASRLGLVGLSEGGMIAPMIAAADTALAGIVLLAPPASSGRALATWRGRLQAARRPGLTAPQRDSAVAAGLTAVERSADPWDRWFLVHDPLAAARRVSRVPVLILQGSSDQQVNPAETPRLAAAFRAGGNRNVTARTFDGLNHLFVPDPDGDPAGYSRLPSFSVPAPVVGAIADWVTSRLGVSRR